MLGQLRIDLNKMGKAVKESDSWQTVIVGEELIVKKRGLNVRGYPESEYVFLCSP